MRNDVRIALCLFMMIFLALGANSARATSVQDLVRLKGHEPVILTGMGIVVGLNGTGDRSKDSLVAARPYAELLRNLGYPIPFIEELARMDSYAIVAVSMEVPPVGARDGDRFDVSVDTLFNAESLEGGRLIPSPLRLPTRDSPDAMPMVIAQGQLIIEGENPRSARVRRGGQMIADIRSNPVTPSGTITLVLHDEYAAYPIATMLAAQINDEFDVGGDGFSVSTGRNIAVVEDARNIRVTLREEYRKQPAEFLSSLLTMNIDPSLIQPEARIVINERKGIILVTGDVEVGPVGVRAAGMSITNITPQPIPSQQQPLIETQQWANLDTTDRTSRSSTRLIDLLRAFDQLKVPVADQIAILFEMKKTGALHAEIISQ